MTDQARRGATLRLFDKAEKEIRALPRAVGGAVNEFQYKFRENPEQPGLRLKQLKASGPGGEKLYSARVTQDYRALLLRLSGDDFLLLSVRHRKDAYDGLDELPAPDKLAIAINRVTGGIEVIDLEAVERTLERRGVVLSEVRDVTGGFQGTAPPEPVPAPAQSTNAAPLFAAFTDEQLTDLGVAEAALPFVAMVTDEDQLVNLGLLTSQLTFEVLTALHEGRGYEDVLEQVTRPVAVEEPIDPHDFEAAAARPATAVTTHDVALEEILEGSFSAWKLFLHPTQRKIVERRYSGPARVSGGPGTGKTIVALHRVQHLATAIEPREGKQILLTTFTKNLAADLRARLLALGGTELLAKVDIVHIDKLAADIAAGAEPEAAGRRRLITDTQALDLWRGLLAELGESGWDAEFLAEEWAHVIVGHAINSRADYYRVRRAGRGRPVSRAERGDIWRLAEHYTKRLEERNEWTFRQVAERAARIEMDRESSWPRHLYRHIVVDEAQDLNAAHWKMLRAMAPTGPDDIFIAGDTHQRIYGNYVSLSSLGINIRGRSSKLTLSYRTTREILGSALELLSGEHYDDLDDGSDDLRGYRSVLHGARPSIQGYVTWAQELDGIVGQLKEWSDAAPSSVAVSVPTVAMVDEVVRHLGRNGLTAFALDSDGVKTARGADGNGVHVSTMHRFKGLEYQRMLVAAVSDGLVPRRAVERYSDSDPVRYRRERRRDRSLLFVAATRARDSLVISWHGKPSPFLP